MLERGRVFLAIKFDFICRGARGGSGVLCVHVFPTIFIEEGIAPLCINISYFTPALYFYNMRPFYLSLQHMDFIKTFNRQGL